GYGVVAYVHDQCRHGHLGQQRAHIEVAHGDTVTDCFGWRHRHSLQFIEPVALLLCCARNELRGEKLTESWIFLAPAQAYQGLHSRELLLFSLRPGALHGSEHEAAEQDQTRDSRRMAYRIRDRYGASLRDA